ncbi:MAG: FAD-binding protein [Rikenellaceae bacterium]
MKKFALQIDIDNCSSCGACLEKCAFGALNLGDYIEVDQALCRLCGACVKVCAMGAIELTKNETPSDNDSRNVWVLAEHDSISLAPITLELIGKAREIADIRKESVEVILIGDRVSQFSDELIEYGADCVHIAENAIFADKIDEHITECAADIISKYNPNILLVGATERGRAVSARLAAKLKTGLTADCTQLSIDSEDGTLLQCRPAFGGNLMAVIKTPGTAPQMASVRQGVMKCRDRECERRGEIIAHDTSIISFDSRIEVLSSIIEKSVAVNLDDSRIIIGIGRGVKSGENVEKIEKFAAQIGAVVAGSRAAVEAGLIDASLQIGQTGHTIAPDLYIAIGISGQIQHTAAITGAKTIIAINKDASAPIFNYSDYGYIASFEDLLLF